MQMSKTSWLSFMDNYTLKACLKRCVLRFDLKMSNVFESRRLTGKPFHKVGADLSNRRSPMFLYASEKLRGAFRFPNAVFVMADIESPAH